MFAWIPIIGPLIDGVVSMFTKWQDTTLGKYQADAQVTSTEIQSSAQITTAFKDDLGLRFLRDLYIFPVVAWTSLIVWDKIIEIRYPDLVWGVKPLEDATGIQWLPYAVGVFLLGWTSVNSWKRA